MKNELNLRAQISELAQVWERIAAVHAEAENDSFKRGIAAGMGNCVYDILALLENGAPPGVPQVPATTVAAYIEAWTAWQAHLIDNGLPGVEREEAA